MGPLGPGLSVSHTPRSRVSTAVVYVDDVAGSSRTYEGSGSDESEPKDQLYGVAPARSRGHRGASVVFRAADGGAFRVKRRVASVTRGRARPRDGGGARATRERALRTGRPSTAA